MTKLTGHALLDFIKANAGRDEGAIVAGAGYATARRGRLNLQRTDFYRAISEANGLLIGDPLPDGRPGKAPGFRLKVGPKGLIPIGRAYSEMCGMAPGSHVTVTAVGKRLVIEADEPAPMVCPARPMASVASVA